MCYNKAIRRIKCYIIFFIKNIYCKGVQAAKFTILYMIKISLMTMKGRKEVPNEKDYKWKSI